MVKTLGVCAALVAVCGAAQGQRDTGTYPLQSFDAEVAVDSGIVRNLGDSVGAVFTEVISVEGADWLRLRFNEVTLAGADRGSNGSYLKITSLEDGAVQYLDRTSARQWGYTSAYFNGDTVIVELIAHPGTGDNELTMNSVIAGQPVVPTAESICGSTDDRSLSNDPRAGRALPIGCTAWMIDDSEHCFLTAGHCNSGGNSDVNVIEFNVPLSDNSCSFPSGLNHPGPEDQYAVDPASQQTNGGLGVGNDWGYLGVFPNSNTGLLPWQAQGDWFEFAPATASATTVARVTGYGSVSSSLAPCSWNAVQKTHEGPLSSFSGNALGYGMDTTGGNSGSPVIDDTTGLAIGIHTHGGCFSSGGANQGTWGGHPALQQALANPTGVCLPQGPMFTFPAGLPDIIPQSGMTIDVTVTTGNDVDPVPSTAALLYSTSTGFVNIPLTFNGGDSYSVTVPGGDCNDVATLAFSIEGTDGEIYNGPANARAIIADGFDDVVILDMEADAGWSTAGSATTGQWTRGVPGDFGRSDPSADADGSGSAWVTGNTPNEDVDGGPVFLLSDVYDVTAIDEPEVSFAIWHATNDPANDQLVIEISDDAGASWTLVESVSSTNGWEERSYRVSDFVSPSTQVQVRFASEDNPNASITESGVDAFAIGAFFCNDSCPADANGDGLVSPSDFNAWIQAFNTNAPECDQNGDGLCSPSDFNAWIQNYNNGC
jgi:hypothetical protein